MLAMARQIARNRLWLAFPALALYGILMGAPLLSIVKLSFSDGLEHYRAVLTSPLLATVVKNTIAISALTTLASVTMAYVCAAALWRSSPLLRPVLLGLVLLPFWTGVLVKNFAWAALLQDNGIINDVLRSTEVLPYPVTLLHNRFAVIVGMVHYVLPYAVFPIYAAMVAIDRQLERAARSLGASTARIWWRVTLPLTLPGVYAASLLVFIISTGFFITPVILGSPGDMMVANMIDFYAHQLVDFGNASALAVIVTAAISLLVTIYQRLPKEGQYGAA
jgi:ABC-type spermidine/putrescine transport system permease subunit I